jgi:hypothetical protein
MRSGLRFADGGGSGVRYTRPCKRWRHG